jgi:hypothetical protein
MNLAPSRLRIDRGIGLCRIQLLPFCKEETESSRKREEIFSHEEKRGRIEIVEENSSPGQGDGWDHFNGQMPLRRSTVSVRVDILDFSRSWAFSWRRPSPAEPSFP